MRRPRPGASALVIAMLLPLAGCGGDGGTLTPGPTPTPTPTSPAPTPTPTSFNVQPCLDQIVTPGNSVTALIIPDTVKLDLNLPPSFPNGRRLQDQVVDITLSYLLLDMRRHNLRTLADLPLNPGRNDATFLPDFPYLAPPLGKPPIASGSASGYDFRKDPDTAFISVDRMGMPAIATALIGTSAKIPYNDSNTGEDAAGRWTSEIKATLTGLHTILGDDLARLSLVSCATPA